MNKCIYKLQRIDKTHLDDQFEACLECNGFNKECGLYTPLTKVQEAIEEYFRRGDRSEK